MQNSVEPIIEHYQKTYELTYELWRQRNRTFLILLGVIGTATILTFRAPKADTLLLAFIAKTAGLSDRQDLATLSNGFPFALVHSIILMVMFYLTVNLNHRALYVLRNYQYLSRLETEIRQHLQLSMASVAFTRESTFYWGARSPLSGVVKWVYFGMLGFLLLAFVSGLLWEDLTAPNYRLAVLDILIGIPTLVFFFDYARLGVSLDTAGAIVGRPQP